MKTLESIRKQQRDWARRCGMTYDSRGYVATLEQNLFSFPLLPETKAAFESAKGQELRATAGQGRMRALDSSSALLVNFFEFWLKHGVEEIAAVCGAPQPMSTMRFQPAYASPLGTTLPRLHMDLEFTGVGEPLVVQSSFTETYRRSIIRTVAESLLKERSMWTGLPGCRDLARRIDRERETRTSYPHLDAPRLLRQIAMLTSTCGVKGFRLRYLWYDFPSVEADEHKKEVAQFAACVQKEAGLIPMSYQQLYQRVKDLPGAERTYLSYLEERYFPRVNCLFNGWFVN